MIKTKVLPEFASIAIGSTVVVQHEDGGPCTHGTVEGKDNIIITEDPTTYTSQREGN